MSSPEDRPTSLDPAPASPAPVQSDEIKLPDAMPDKWLGQIQEALKKDRWKTFWITLLGSSVMAAVITGFTNFRLESYKKQAAIELEEVKKGIMLEVEKEKIRLQTQNAELGNRKTAYHELKANFQKFDVDLSLYVLTCEAAYKGNKEEILVKYSEDKLETLVKQMEVFVTPPKYDDLKEIYENINVFLTSRISKILNMGEDAINNYPALRNLYESEIKPEVKKIMSLFEAKEKTLTI